MAASTDKICDDLRAYFRKKKLTQGEVADMLGVTTGAVNSLLSRRPFGKAAAERWSEVFGFSVPYLISGEGSLFGDKGEPAGNVIQTAIGNNGVTIQQNGANVNGTSDEGAKEGYFMRLANELMAKLVEKEDHICCLERELQEYKKNEQKSK